MDLGTIYEKLTVIFREILGNDDLTLSPDMTASDVPGWDSTAMVMIILAVEEKFGVKVRSREVDRLSSVGDLANLISVRS